jgi:hypothetical protein
MTPEEFSVHVFEIPQETGSVEPAGHDADDLVSPADTVGGHDEGGGRMPTSEPGEQPSTRQLTTCGGAAESDFGTQACRPWRSAARTHYAPGEVQRDAELPRDALGKDDSTE